MKANFRNALLVYAGVIPNLLFSFYFHELKIAPFPLISAVILTTFGIMFFKKLAQKKIVSTQLFFILSIYLTISFFWSLLTSREADITFYFQSFFGLFLSIGAFLGLIGLSTSPTLKEHAHSALIAMFYISLICFYVQAISWYVYAYELDFIKNFTGEEQRLIGHQLEIGEISTKRFAGLFSEPGLYCWVMIGLGYFVFEKTDKRNSEKINYALYLAYILSIFISFSFFGWVMVVLVEFTRNLKFNSPKSLSIFALTFGGIFILFFPFIKGYWEARILLLADDGSYNDKMEVINILTRYLSDIYYFFLGTGVATKIESPSLGFVQSSVLAIGVLGAITLFAFITHTSFKVQGRLISKIFVTSYILLTGYYLSSTITWFVFGSMVFMMSHKWEN